MQPPFPFGYPAPTAFYLTLYVLTLVIHVVTMNYVLAGSAWLAAMRCRPRLDADADPAVRLLSDWMPLMLSAAITAGIAPLLFIQILYRTQFYTANLLLFHRWMAILPVLIVVFYLLYLIRKPATLAGRPGLRRWLTVAVFLGFGFIGWSWTENHLLSLQSQEVWSAEFVRSGLVYWTAELPPRLATWFCGSFPVLAVWLLWQFRWTGVTDDAPDEAAARRESARRLTRAALVMLGLAALFAGLYVRMLPAPDRGMFLSPLTLPWVGAASLGVSLQAVALWRMRALDRYDGDWLWLATAGVLLGTLGIAVLRESLRLARLDLPALVPRHAEAYAIEGFGVFAAFLVVNTLLVAWCIRLTRTRD